MRTKATEQPRKYQRGIPRVITSMKGVKSLTRQDHAEQVNINHIYARTQRGELIMGSGREPQYGDFSNVLTYDQSLNQINQAKMEFMELPASVRKEYDNDPQKWYDSTLQEASDRLEADKKAVELAKQEQAENEAVEAAETLLRKKGKLD